MPTSGGLYKVQTFLPKEKYIAIKTYALQEGISMAEALRRIIEEQNVRLPEDLDIKEINLLLNLSTNRYTRVKVWDKDDHLSTIVNSFAKKVLEGVMTKALLTNNGYLKVAIYTPEGDKECLYYPMYRYFECEGKYYTYRWAGKRKTELEWYEIDKPPEGTRVKIVHKEINSLKKGISVFERTILKRFAEEIMGEQLKRVVVNDKEVVAYTEEDYFHYYPDKGLIKLDWLKYQFDGKDFVRLDKR